MAWRTRGLTDNVVAVAMAPLLVENCQARRLDSVPFLLALACASSAGSAAAILGSPETSWVDGTVSRIGRFRIIAASETHITMGS